MINDRGVPARPARGLGHWHIMLANVWVPVDDDCPDDELEFVEGKLVGEAEGISEGRLSPMQAHPEVEKPYPDYHLFRMRQQVCPSCNGCGASLGDMGKRFWCPTCGDHGRVYVQIQGIRANCVADEVTLRKLRRTEARAIAREVVAGAMDMLAAEWWGKDSANLSPLLTVVKRLRETPAPEEAPDEDLR